MKLTVLGASGGIGQGNKTTCFLFDEDILIDAGTGLGDLPLEALVKIDHVFLTHAHFDHIACLPMLIDTVGSVKGKPITVYALPEVIDVLQKHIFNWAVWPDFTAIPNKENPFLRFCTIKVGESIDLGKVRACKPLPATHTVPACGYVMFSEEGNALAYTGDTAYCPEFWKMLEEIPSLTTLIVECAFPTEEATLAELSKHFQPNTLLPVLVAHKNTTKIYVTHLKPFAGNKTLSELSGVESVLSVKCINF